MRKPMCVVPKITVWEIIIAIFYVFVSYMQELATTTKKLEEQLVPMRMCFVFYLNSLFQIYNKLYR